MNKSECAKYFSYCSTLANRMGNHYAGVIAYFLGAPVIAAAGVALFGRNFGTTFKMLYPDKIAAIAFDSDWRTKPQVRAALIALQGQLMTAGVDWKVRCWPSDYKGYDDFLCAARHTEEA